MHEITLAWKEPKFAKNFRMEAARNLYGKSWLFYAFILTPLATGLFSSILFGVITYFFNDAQAAKSISIITFGVLFFVMFFCDTCRFISRKKATLRSKNIVISNVMFEKQKYSYKELESFSILETKKGIKTLHLFLRGNRANEIILLAKEVEVAKIIDLFESKMVPFYTVLPK